MQKRFSRASDVMMRLFVEKVLNSLCSGDENLWCGRGCTELVSLC